MGAFDMIGIVLSLATPIGHAALLSRGMGPEASPDTWRIYRTRVRYGTRRCCSIRRGGRAFRPLVQCAAARPEQT